MCVCVCVCVCLCVCVCVCVCVCACYNFHIKLVRWNDYVSLLPLTNYTCYRHNISQTTPTLCTCTWYWMYIVGMHKKCNVHVMYALLNYLGQFIGEGNEKLPISLSLVWRESENTGHVVAFWTLLFLRERGRGRGRG